MDNATAPYVLTSLTGQAGIVQDWLHDNASALVGVPLRILLIIVVAALLRAVAKRTITRVVERFIESPEEESAQEDGGPRSRGSGALWRDRNRASERRHQRARTIGSVLSNIAAIVIVVTAMAMVLDQLGIALGPLLASAGVVGLAIGFGAQSLVADYLSGMLIMVEDQYGVGDMVDLGEAVGEVEEVGLRLTRVRDLHGGLWHVRNGEILRVKNDSQGWARAVLDIPVAYGSDLDEVRRILEETGRRMRAEPAYRRILLEDPSVWGVQTLGADGVEVRVAVKTVPLQQWAVSREFSERIKNELDAAGVDIPFPQRTIWIRNEDGANGLGRETGAPAKSGSRTS
jgi:small-conductance mechanosensitive channel